MKNDKLQQMIGFFKALGDESRLKIIGLLADQECSVEELAVLLALKEPTISHHLMKLKQLKLVRMRPEGNTHFYQLDKGVLETITKDMFHPQTIASLADGINLETWEIKVLNTYIEGDFENPESMQYLREIPSGSKKRLTIIKWVSDKFEMGVEYPENTVNEILNRYYPDFESLRKLLIDSQFMQEKNGIYSRY